MKLFWDMNDSELLYLISEHNEEAFNLMYNKYSVFIRKTINQLNENDLYKEELFQEGLLILNKAIISFNNKYEKSFLGYFELILKRHLYKLLKEQRTYEKIIIRREVEFIFDDFLQQEEQFYNERIIFDNKMDQMIYDELIIGNRKVKSFCQQYNLEPKKIYNKIYYIRKYKKS